MKTIVMLGYKSGSGKDALAELLIKRDGFIRLAFADKLKSVCSDLFCLSHDQVYGDLKNVQDMRYKSLECFDTAFLTPRRILQDTGNKLREIYPDIWANYLANVLIPDIFDDIYCEALNCEKIVITDFRFPNEYNCVKNYVDNSSHKINLYSVNIVRDIVRNFSGASNISEIALDDWNNWNFVIKNEENKLEDTYKELKNKLNL